MRFPREWLGPHEDLVPIDLTDDALPAPPAPDDFWGEGSSDLQSALVSPAGVPRNTSDDDANGEPEAEPAVGPTGPPAPVARRRLTSSMVVAATAAAALVAAIAVLSSLGSGHQATHPRVAAVIGQRPVRSSQPAAVGRRVAVSRHASRRRHAVRTHRRATYKTTKSTPVSYTASKGGAGTTSASTQTYTPTSSSYTSSSYTASSGSGTGSVSHASTAAGPTGPGAPFGPGVMK